jgi:hypothetical protein
VAGPLLLASAFLVGVRQRRLSCGIEPSLRFRTQQRRLSRYRTSLRYASYNISFTALIDLAFAFPPAPVSTVIHTVILRIDPCNSGDSSAARTGRGAMHGFLFLPPDASHTRPSTSRDNLHHLSPLDRLRLRDRSCVGACRCAAQVSGNCTREQAHQTCPRRRML